MAITASAPVMVSDALSPVSLIAMALLTPGERRRAADVVFMPVCVSAKLVPVVVLLYEVPMVAVVLWLPMSLMVVCTPTVFPTVLTPISEMLVCAPIVFSVSDVLMWFTVCWSPSTSVSFRVVLARVHVFESLTWVSAQVLSILL